MQVSVSHAIPFPLQHRPSSWVRLSGDRRNDARWTGRSRSSPLVRPWGTARLWIRIFAYIEGRSTVDATLLRCPKNRFDVVQNPALGASSGPTARLDFGYHGGNPMRDSANPSLLRYNSSHSHCTLVHHLVRSIAFNLRRNLNLEETEHHHQFSEGVQRSNAFRLGSIIKFASPPSASLAQMELNMESSPSKKL